MDITQLQNKKWMVRIGNIERTGFEMTAHNGLVNQFDSKEKALIEMVKNAEWEILRLRQEVAEMMGV